MVYHRRGWANAPRHRCIIEPGNPTGGQPFRSNEKEPRASIQEGARALSLSLSLSRIEGYGEPEEVENKRKGLQKSMEEDISPTFFSRLCSSSKLFHVFSETVVSERDLEEVFLGKEENVD